jgi:lipopolysaccharide biosynthesis protein
MVLPSNRNKHFLKGGIFERMIIGMSNNSNKTICIYSHFSSENGIPLHVKIYLEELQNYFDEVLLVTNTREIQDGLKGLLPKTSILLVKNEGYDFGMFYKAFHQLDPDGYAQIACINDSNIIFGSLKFLFDWGNDEHVDFWGLVDSHQKPKYSTHQNNYHIQSHFLVFNRAAIELLPAFFSKVNFDELIKENNISQLKRNVINEWEIGITQFLISKNLRCKTFIDSKEYSDSYKNGEPVNVPTKLYAETIANGVPFIKKRVITSTELRHMLSYKGHWKRLIRKHGGEGFKIEEMIDELKAIRKRQIQNKFMKLLKGH